MKAPRVLGLLGMVALASCSAAQPVKGPAQACSDAYARAKSLASSGRLYRALRTLERSTAACNGMDQRAARFLRFELLLDLGRHDEARALGAEIARDASSPADQRRAVSRAPRPVSSAEREAPLLTLGAGDQAFVRGDGRAALAAYESVWKRQPWHARALVGAGLAARMSGDEPLARAHFDRALAAFEAWSEQRAIPVRVQLSEQRGRSALVRVRVQFERGDLGVLFLRDRKRWLPVRVFGDQAVPMVRAGVYGAFEAGAIVVFGNSGEELLRLEGCSDFAVSTDGRRALGWSSSHLVLFDLRTATQIAERKEETHRHPNGLAMTPPEWNFDAGPPGEESHEGEHLSVLPAWSGRLSVRGTSAWVSGAEGWSWWDLASGKTLHAAASNVELELSPGGRRLALMKKGERPEDSSITLTVLEPNGKRAPALKARVEDGRRFLVSDERRVAWWGKEGNWIADLAPEGWRKRQLDRTGRAVAISKDGKLLALGGEPATVVSTDSGKLVSGKSSADPHIFSVNAQAFTADGKWYWSERDWGVGLYEARTRARRATIVATGEESFVVFFEDGSVERLGAPGAAEQLACRFGGLIAPFEVCEERALVRGKLASLLSGKELPGED